MVGVHMNAAGVALPPLDLARVWFRLPQQRFSICKRYLAPSFSRLQHGDDNDKRFFIIVTGFSIGCITAVTGLTLRCHRVTTAHGF